MDFLLEASPAESAKPFCPRIEEPNVTWKPSRGHVRCTWYDSKRKKHRTKSEIVEFAEGLPDSAKQELVSAVAAELQEYYMANHSEPPNEEDSFNGSES